MTDTENSTNAAASSRPPTPRDRRTLGTIALVFAALGVVFIAAAILFKATGDPNDLSGFGGMWFLAPVAEGASVVTWLVAVAVTAKAGWRIRSGSPGRRRSIVALALLVVTPLAWVISAQM